jgi:hypothetical protein
VSALVTIVVEPSRIPEREGARNDSDLPLELANILQRALAARLGIEVEILERYLSEAPREGVLLLFTSGLDHALAEAPPGTAGRVFLLNGSRSWIPGALERHGLAGAADLLFFYAWARSPTASTIGPLYVRRDVAAALGGVYHPYKKVEGYVLLHDERWRVFPSRLGACVAVLLGRAPPPHDPPLEPPPFPIGRTLAGKYVIRERVSGTPYRGLYCAGEAMDPDGLGKQVWVSLGLQQTVPWDDKRAELELPEEGFAPLLDIVALDHDGTRYDALIEKKPIGGTVHDLLPLPLSARHAARILLPVLDWVRGAHHRGRVVYGLRPEHMFLTLTAHWPDDTGWRPRWGMGNRPEVTGIAPRCERFLLTAARPCHGFGPLFETLYMAPEILALRPPGPAADVFSLAAILAHWVGGRYPFSGDSMVARMGSMMTGGWARFEGPEPLMELLEEALSPDPASRPPLEAMRDALAELV